MTRKRQHASLLPVLGLNSSTPAEYIDNRETPNCLNMRVDKMELYKRYGVVNFGASMGQRVVGAAEFLVEMNRNLIRVGRSKIERWDGVARVWRDIAPTTSPLTATDRNRVYFAYPNLAGRKVVVFTNGHDPIRMHDGGVGNTAILGGSPPIAQFLKEYKSYLVLANVVVGGFLRPQRVQWSDTGDIQKWTGGNAGSVDLVEDDLPITAITNFDNFICVHKENTIYIGYLVATSSVFQFDRKNTGVGTICQATIQNLPTGEQIFLGKNGIYIFNGSSARMIESQVNDEIRQTMAFRYIELAWSMIDYEFNEYLLGIPTGSQTEPQTIFRFNYKTRQCVKDFRPDISCGFSFIQTDVMTWDGFPSTTTIDSQTRKWNESSLLSFFPLLAFGSSDGRIVHKETIYTDSGAPIEAFWESKDYEADEKGRLARWLQMSLWAKGNSVRIQYSTNSGMSWDDVGVYTLQSDYPSDTSPLMAYFDVVSSKIRFRFSNNNNGEWFAMKQFIVGYFNREVRG